ncbi:BolA family protein [Brachymonas sp. G13]|uniref:BolA family protein n=1 Tax=Brachymonas TaxID=28219 RepID=UPI001695CD7F|nr:BolA family protein [Brachymonas sp. J145]MEE1653935.1 BolA family protein [Brachymonas sp. J145]NLX16514.1 BolA family transcriptional regulator [Ramlibacter sp.]
MTADELRSLLAAGLPCDHLEVEGDGRHWFAVIVSPVFEGKRLIARHQLVYAALGERIQTDEVHALSMKTMTPAEWAQLSEA